MPHHTPQIVAKYIRGVGTRVSLLWLVKSLLREDKNFHSDNSSVLILMVAIQLIHLMFAVKVK